VIADSHLRNQHLGVTEALALLDGEGLAHRQELRVLLDIGDQIEHLSRRERHAPGCAEAGHRGAGYLRW
jgi:hypothetical protein